MIGFFMAHSLRVPSQEWLRFAALLRGPLSSFWRGQKNKNRPAVRPESNRVPVIMRASFFRLVLRNKTGFPELGHFLFGAIRVPVRPEITHRLPTKRDAKSRSRNTAATRLRACSPVRPGAPVGEAGRAGDGPALPPLRLRAARRVPVLPAGGARRVASRGDVVPPANLSFSIATQ